MNLDQIIEEIEKSKMKIELSNKGLMLDENDEI